VVSTKHGGGVEREKIRRQEKQSGQIAERATRNRNNIRFRPTDVPGNIIRLLITLPPPESLSIHIICSQASKDAFALVFRFTSIRQIPARQYATGFFDRMNRILRVKIPFC
jgi:hypothetical protein